MSKRRHVGDVVLLDDEDGTGPYLGRIDARGAERGDYCPLTTHDDDHDPDCAEWPNVAVLGKAGRPTGAMIYHVPECRMADPE